MAKFWPAGHGRAGPDDPQISNGLRYLSESQGKSGTGLIYFPPTKKYQGDSCLRPSGIWVVVRTCMGIVNIEIKALISFSYK